MLGARLCIRGEECDPVQLRSALAETARIAKEASVVRESMLKNECGKNECISSPSRASRGKERKQPTSRFKSHDCDMTGP